MTEESVGQQYNQAIIEWREATDEFRVAVENAAVAKARYEAERAKRLVQTRHDYKAEKLAVDVLKGIVDGDPQMEQLYANKLVTEAKVEGLKALLRWHNAHADNLRSRNVDERQQNAFESQAGAGPGRSTFEPSYTRAQPPQRPAGTFTPPPPDDEEPGQQWWTDPAEGTGADLQTGEIPERTGGRVY